MLSFLLLILVISFFPAVFGSLIIFDVLVRREYSLHRVDWVSDGRPLGLFWVPNETKVANRLLVKSGSSLARRKAAYGWVFATPKWVSGDPLARRQEAHSLFGHLGFVPKIIRFELDAAAAE